jgi:hypothetical protein
LFWKTISPAIDGSLDAIVALHAGDGDPDRLCGFATDHQLELCRLHDGQISGFGFSKFCPRSWRPGDIVGNASRAPSVRPVQQPPELILPSWYFRPNPVHVSRKTG